MEEKEVCYHVPVMLHESLEGLDIQPSGVYVDVTFGGGGHSREILNRLNDEGELYGFDQDADAEKNIPADSRFVFVRSNFRYLYNFMRYHGVAGEVDGLLADLGVSSHHFDDKDRGFSFRFDGALDMRMNTRAGQTAADIVNTYTEEQLADLFYLYGELKVARKLASVLVRSREMRTPIARSKLSPAVPPSVSSIWAREISRRGWPRNMRRTSASAWLMGVWTPSGEVRK